MICKNPQIVYKNFFTNGALRMRIGVVGINHRLAELKLRESLARTCQKRFGPGYIHHPSHSFVLLSTCNRTEIYFCSDDLTETHSYLINLLRTDTEEDFDQKLYSFFGPDCFLHLCRVTAGLDSAIVAETEIQGQVKTAYEKTFEQISIPSDLHFLFQKSLQIGKKVRSKLPMQRGLPNIEHAILNAGTMNNPNFSRDCPVLFIGASEINLKICHFLKTKGYSNLTICNRTPKRSEEYGVDILPWEQFNRWIEFDWIIAGTKAQAPLIHAGNLPGGLTAGKILFDLSVPRNIDHKVSEDSRITLWNIDQLNQMLHARREKMNHLLLLAEQIVTTSTENYLTSFRKREHIRQGLLETATA